MGTLVFNGHIVDGSGLFSKEIGLPADLLSGHESWIHTFVQGTLNIRLSIPELPSKFRRNGLRTLDLNDDFPPEIYRVGSEVENNTIKPSPTNPRSGDLQLWRALLVNKNTNTEHKCYLIRRVESGYRDKAEILGAINFKQNCGFENGHLVYVTVFVNRNEIQQVI